MKRVYRLFGIPVWSITSDETDDDAADLSGGTLGSDRVDVDGSTDRFMGFTNGREVD